MDMKLAPATSEERCTWIDYFSEMTPEGSYQKRCADSGNFLVQGPLNPNGCHACRKHLISWAALAEEQGTELKVTHFLTPEKWQKYLAITARLEELHTMPYREYLLTPEWQARRKRILERDEYRCQICNSPHRLNVHHRDYSRRGYENDTDLTTLCQGCHQVFHENSRLARVEA